MVFMVMVLMVMYDDGCQYCYDDDEVWCQSAVMRVILVMVMECGDGSVC